MYIYVCVFSAPDNPKRDENHNKIISVGDQFRLMKKLRIEAHLTPGSVSASGQYDRENYVQTLILAPH